MSSSILFVLLVVPSILCGKQAIDPETLRNVFGSPEAQYYAAASSVIPLQAMPVLPANETQTDADTELPAAAVSDYDKFDWTLTKRVSSTMNANFLLSPLGLKLALAILCEAATGLTRSELASVIGFELDRLAVRKKFSTIVESLQKPSQQYILNLGSKIYLDNNVQPRQQFAAIAQEFYKTELTPVNFHDPAVAAQTINSWVANITQGNINKLVDPDDVANVVVLVLNTLYFKGTWRHQFDPNATSNGSFYTTPKIQKPVKFMRVKEKFFYAESAKYDAKILRMPYLGNKFAMYVIVPNSLAGLPLVFQGLSTIRAEMDTLRERLVEVTMPKFKFDYTSQLDDILKELGVRQAFEDTASFPGLARGQALTQRLRVSKVLQRSGIEVNELGSVAYFATEISLVNKFGEDDETSVELIANKPFFFFIQDETTRQLLFTGVVADPSLVDGALKLEESDSH